MTDESKPINIVLSAELYETLRKDAELSLRSEANQVVWVLKEYYRTREAEAELFNPIQLREGKRGDVPVFRTPDQTSPGPVSKLHEKRGRDES